MLSAAAATEKIEICLILNFCFPAAEDTIGVDLSSESNNTIKPGFTTQFRR